MANRMISVMVMKVLQKKVVNMEYSQDMMSFTTTMMMMIRMTRMKKDHFVDLEVPTNYQIIAVIRNP